MQGFVEEVKRLDAGSDESGLIALMQSGRHAPEEMFPAVPDLLSRLRVRFAYIIAMLLANTKYPHPIVYLALSVGGLLFDNEGEEQRGLARLQTLGGVLSPAQQAAMDQAIIYPVMVHLLQTALDKARHADTQALPAPDPDAAFMGRALEILKAAAPRFRTRFDWDAAVPDISPEAVRRHGAAPDNLVVYGQPAEDMSPVPRRALVAAWGAGAELVSHITIAMNTYGWVATYVQLSSTTVRDDGCQAIMEACRRHNAEVLVVTLDTLATIGAGAYNGMLEQLRRNPALKVVGFISDAWGGRAQTMLAQVAAYLDGVWTVDSPSLPLWREPALANKVLHAPPPRQVNRFRVREKEEPHRPLQPTLFFSGSIQGWNWPRAFWLAAMARERIPHRKEQSSSFFTAALPAEENHAFYMRYMQRLAEATCCLNLTMRQSQECVVTARCFDIPLSGALLVQEATPDLSRYFVAGKHYLEFTSMADLKGVMRFIANNREEAESIRQRGHAFARERYSDERMIGYLDHLLYGAM